MRNYLEKIYKLPVIDVRARIAMGKTRRDPGKGYIIKDDDTKLAYVTFPKEVSFKFPNVFPEDSEAKKALKDDEKGLDASKERYQEFLQRNKDRKDLPGWYSF